MMLSDHDIRRLCKGVESPMIEPFAEGSKTPNTISYGLTSAGFDLRLAPELWTSKQTYGEVVVDPKRMKEDGYCDRIYDRLTLEESSFVLPPHSYVLGRTHEYLRMPSDLCGTVVGKSTLARCGVLINCTPVEPGWFGYLVVEIGNESTAPVKIYFMEGICQIQFHQLSTNPDQDYQDRGGIYQGQTGITPARVRG